MRPSAPFRHPSFLPPSATLLLWPVVLLVVAWVWAAPAPMHKDWDVFSYLDAANAGRGYVPLGFGRPLFCVIGTLCAEMSRLLYGPWELFGTFRLWVLAGVALQGTALTLFAWVLARRLGLAAAHLALALLVAHADWLDLTLAVWPETWATAFGFLSAAVLLAPWRGSWTWAVAAAFAILMLLMKETAAAYLPALALLALLKAQGPLSSRLLTAGLWAVAVAALALGLSLLLTRLIPGLHEARLEWLRNHFGQETVGADSFGANARKLAETLWRHRVLNVLVVLGAARLGLLWRKRQARWAAAALALAILFPTLLAVFAGATYAIPRYAVGLVPGLAVLAGCTLLRPWPPRLAQLPALATLLAIAIITVAFLGGRWGDVRVRQRLARADAGRYTFLTLLRQERLAHVAADDAKAAEFVAKWAGPQQADWVILWPGWELDSGARAPLPWVAEQRTAGYRLTVSATASSRAEEDMAELLNEYPVPFTRHPSGLWVETRQPAESSLSGLPHPVAAKSFTEQSAQMP